MTATLSLLPPLAHFMFKGNRPGVGGGVAYEKDDDCSFQVLSPLAISMPKGRIN